MPDVEETVLVDDQSANGSTDPAPPVPATPSAAPVPARTPSPAPRERQSDARPIQPATAEPSAPREPTFSQKELDERIGKARNEGRAAAYRYIGKELGVAVVSEDGSVDLSGLRTLVEQARAGNVQATQRIQELDARSQELLGQLAEKDSEVKGAHLKAQRALRLGEAKATAVSLGFADPKDAIALLGDLDRFAADVEAGTVTGLDVALQQLAEQKPYLLRQTSGPAAPPPAIPPTPAPADSRSRQAADDEIAREVIAQQARSFF